MFVCRYKFIKVRNSYRLVPLQFANEEVPADRSRRKSSAESIDAKRTRRSSVGVTEITDSGRKRRTPMNTNNNVEFIDLNYFNAENKVSPIKIIGGRSVIRLSAKKKATHGGKSSENNDLNANYLPPSPLAEQNHKITPQSKASAARRNLNLSLNNSAADTTADSD
ncbi:hypothetical protein DOY81_009927 [Sarcophaga bullata]|nr:hypothetical protein DOY81_009927 [Sarcophaga bullata]